MERPLRRANIALRLACILQTALLRARAGYYRVYVWLHGAISGRAVRLCLSLAQAEPPATQHAPARRKQYWAVHSRKLAGCESDAGPLENAARAAAQTSQPHGIALRCE